MAAQTGSGHGDDADRVVRDTLQVGVLPRGANLTPDELREQAMSLA